MSRALPGPAPSVDLVARHLVDTGLPHPVLVDLARQVIGDAERPEPDQVLQAARRAAATYSLGLLQPLINATGVLLHTNLGRAPMPVRYAEAYTNLEFDLRTGRRGDRSGHAAALVARACGAESALVVNNGAAAVLLVLSVLAAGREVVISRGELVEIGGGFRIPELLAQSGARLVEVGTTNRTRLADYAAAVGPDTAVLLKVHTSNFRITGFTESVEVTELAELRLPVVADLGSGLLDARCSWLSAGPPDWLVDEPAAAQTLSGGADLVTFSGDKLMGGPQAGIIAGKADLIARCRRHPLARALRPGGLVLQALQDVALSYLRRDAGEMLPLWRMATTPVELLRGRAEALAAGQVVDCESVMGGGTLPSVLIPSAGVALVGDVSNQLRRATPPVVAHVKDGHTICDLRTVFPKQDGDLSKALKTLVDRVE